MSGSLRLISRRFIPRMAPFRKMFSRPVSSPWKPVPTSSRLPTRPRMTALPRVGVVIRVRILSSVDLPAPFGPMMPSTSPCSTEKETSSRAQISSALGRCSRCRSRFAPCAIVSRSVS